MPIPQILTDIARLLIQLLPAMALVCLAHRPICLPDMNATIDPNTAPPAPTGATTLPIQLMKLKNAPSGCAPV